METLKIAFYTDSYLPSRDGVVTSIINTRKELERRGHEVYVFASGGGETAKLAKKDKRLYVIKGMKFNKYPQYTMGLINRESMKVMEIMPDVIHAHTPFTAGLFGYRASVQLNTKFIGTFHTMVFSDEAIAAYFTNNRTVMKLSRFVVMRYLKWFYSKTDSVIAPTLYVKDILKKNGLKNIQIIPTGIDFDSMKREKREKARMQLGLSSKDKIILYFGRVSREKNIEILIKAAKPLSASGFKVIIAGSGPYTGELRTLSKKIGNKNVIFAGFIKENDIPLYYASADILCNPSTFETQGIVDLYASFYGIPLLLPEKGAQEELLKYAKCGEKFNVHSIKNLVEKANFMYENAGKYKFGGVIKEFDVKKTVDKLIALYNKI
ncbi:MAG: glycosyltransferase [Candidatus Parvarchaeota archaeon]|jgi:1,2-diacylglycerol 3-alpha-glucosyltransferase|nr:glycosyltransferase [Candidatus Parvarchaeota archaeon]